ncbi:ABC transporter substrate-binding protein [Natrarchaeobaculum aegyptiacum]|uniref:ABC transporter substrate-binding protein n=1 Tax=Natrarchaeobaculum aegyptiacum TaxID=745377 RepID=A0A2Z2HWN3_9EURY|nr:ABC transporter substrate-binding protein [Natrarchaeobaculum aegyptiacum]ARS91273.1 ABC transporter substrate-binding protein [Natrarchaeobaculum aegyptiacum]
MCGSPRPSNRDSSGVDRRSLLAATGVGLSVATSGCIRQVRSAINRDDPEQLSLTITTRTADGDRESIQLARAVRTALERAGIAVDLDMRSEEEFFRSVLINQDFDVYVGQHPGDVDPDVLYEALHSRFVEEAGWQNPFGLSSRPIDERLEAQRLAPEDEREAEVEALLEAFVAEQPFVPICAREEFRLVRTDRFGGWNAGHPATRLGYLGLEVHDDASQLRIVHTDARVSKNLNPLSAEYREVGVFADLCYDSLATETGDGAVVPWLASSFEYDDGGDAEGDETGGRLEVELREDCSFHDGESVTVDDVVFTYQFLRDTTRGTADYPAPTPRFRGRVSIVDEVTVLDRDEGRLAFSVSADEPVAERALLVPILPEHVWADRDGRPDIPGVQIAEGTTDALVTDDVPPVGSGPYQFAVRSEREHVTFERYDDHFTTREDVSLPGPTAAELRVQIDPRSTSAIELVETDAADVTSLPLESYVVGDVLESESIEGNGDVEVLESPSWSFYHLGFNLRRAPFGNPNFRQVVARLLDRETLIADVFDGYARPTVVPVTEEWTPDSLAWDDGPPDPVGSFLGSDGTVDPGAAREAFEDAGFGYGDDGRLRVRR